MRDQKKENLISAIAYIPMVGIFMYFFLDDKTDKINKHIKYGIILFILLVAINIILKATLLFEFLTFFTMLGYLGISGFLGFKAYSGENMDVEILDNIDKKVKDNFAGYKEQNKKTEKEIDDVLKDSNF